MFSANQNHTSCIRCSFSPCCYAEENTQWMKQISQIVKQSRTLKRHEVLCLPKNKFYNLYAIQQGVIKTYQAEAGGNELIRGFYFAGEILGYEAIYANRYLFTAVALADTLICEIPYSSFLELLQTHPDQQKHILYLISRQLNAGSYLLATTAEQRVAAFLIDLSVRLHASEKKLELALPMTRQDIGNYLRLTAETISRVLSKLKQKNIITIQHKMIHILEIKQLHKIADDFYYQV